MTGPPSGNGEYRDPNETRGRPTENVSLVAMAEQHIRASSTELGDYVADDANEAGVRVGEHARIDPRFAESLQKGNARIVVPETEDGGVNPGWQIDSQPQHLSLRSPEKRGVGQVYNVHEVAVAVRTRLLAPCRPPGAEAPIVPMRTLPLAPLRAREHPRPSRSCSRRATGVALL